MDVKSDDTLIVDIDPAIILGYKFEQLNLDPIDFFDQMPSNDLKNEDKIDAKIDSLLKDNKINELTLSNTTEKKTENVIAAENKLCDTKIIDETSSEYLEIKKDINGNDESVSEENLNKLFVQLELSDSDNEEDDTDDLHERGPVRSSKSKRANRRKDVSNLWCKTSNYDKAQFDSERLKFLSGSSQVQYNESAVPDQYAIYNNQNTIYGGTETSYNLLSQDSYFEDTIVSSVGSPESGYDSSSTHNTRSPPPVLFPSLNLDFIPETVDDQNLLDFLIENADSALNDDNLADCNIDDKEAKGKINEIKNFLLNDIPGTLCVSSNVVASFHKLLNAVPFSTQSTVSSISDMKSSPVSNISEVKSSPILNSLEVKSSLVSNLSEVKLPPVSSNTTIKCLEKSKKLVPKLKDDAKSTLRKFLSEEEYYDANKRIYEKIRKDKDQGKPISVIYVEDEMEKDSKNRTNLHNAVLNGKIEDIFSIVEIHKQYDLPFTAINIRDRNNKTALDYAVQNQMTLVADYLKENTACQSVNVEK